MGLLLIALWLFQKDALNPATQPPLRNEDARPIPHFDSLLFYLFKAADSHRELFHCYNIVIEKYISF